MQHTIPVHAFGEHGGVMAEAVEKCVHCGFCLAACPTYAVLGEEMDSPRGRIILMKSVLEGSLELDQAMPYVDRCLGCQSCVTACPSGVPYGELLTPFRAYAEKRRRRPLAKRAARRLAQSSLPYPSRFRLAVGLGNITRPVHKLLPKAFRPMVDMLPPTLSQAERLPAICPARGVRRARVALLAGCVQQALDPEINWDTLRVLAYNGVEVLVPAGQGCCGGLSIHIGDDDQARSLAIRNLKAFPTDVDAILTNAAGCGSGIQEYPLLFKGTEWEGQAGELAALVQDVALFLDKLGLVEPQPVLEPLKLAYHDACHLAHAQRVTSEPRRLLGKIPQLSLVEIPEGEYCCGSAGTYNLEQPETARILGERKARNILSTGAQAVATGNIGCMVQLRSHFKVLGVALPVLHTMQVLDRAYRGGDDEALFHPGRSQ
jgi:glycolate oxidase iron-sulfur subunit